MTDHYAALGVVRSASSAEIRRAYDGSSTAFRALEGGGWGELVNLGFHPWYALPGVLFGLGPFQRGLARRSIALVEPRPGMRVLYAGCGRGYTTARLAAAGCAAIGIDLLAASANSVEMRFRNAARSGMSIGCAEGRYWS